MKELTSVATHLVMVGLRWWWITGSSAALALGAAIALAYYPEAGFESSNPYAQLESYQLGFALSVGFPLALLQSLTLAFAMRERSFTRLLLLALWIPVTSGGIAAMIVPLWWVDGLALAFAPWKILVYAGPGMLALGFAQWFILWLLFDIKLPWVTYTVTGAAIGVFVGLLVALLMASLLPLEVIWAGVMGAAIGAAQVPWLEDSLLDKLLRRWRIC